MNAKKRKSPQNTNSETLMCKQKEKIEQINQRILVNRIAEPTNEEIKRARKSISFNNDEDNDWRYATFSTIISSTHDEAPSILSNQWNIINANQQKGLEIRNLIFINESEINYLIVNSIIKGNVLLKGESSFFLILRSNSVLSEDSVVICINKEEYVQKVYLSLGTFIKPEYAKDNELQYKVFAKQQLIVSLGKKNEAINAPFIETDACSIKFTIEDCGTDTINVIASVNDSSYDNNLSGSFFLPTIGKKKVMIAGSGQQCKIKSFSNECFYKEKYMSHETNLMVSGNRSCDCCIIC